MTLYGEYRAGSGERDWVACCACPEEHVDWEGEHNDGKEHKDEDEEKDANLKEACADQKEEEVCVV